MAVVLPQHPAFILFFTPFASPGQAPAYLVRGLLPHGAIAFAKRARRADIARELRAVHTARRLGIGHLVTPVWGWRHPSDDDATYLVSHYLDDAVMLARHPHGAARLRALDEWEKLGLLRWQQATGDNDRHAENYLVLPNGRVRAIDYGAAFHPEVAPEGGVLHTRADQNVVWQRAWRGGERAALATWSAYSRRVPREERRHCDEWRANPGQSARGATPRLQVAHLAALPPVARVGAAHGRP